MSVLGNNIYEARIALDWSQREAADRLGVTTTTWSRWECDQATPGVSHLQSIAELLGTSVSDLTRGV